MNLETIGDSLRRIGLNAAVARAYRPLAKVEGEPARVVEVHRTHCVLHTGEALCNARAMPGIETAVAFAVGDWVIAQRNAYDEWWIGARVAPYTELSRLSPSGERQILVSNVDYAFLVMGLDGDFNPRRLERYLALAQAGGVTPVVVLTKADQCDDVEARLDELANRLPASIERLAVNATAAAAVESLACYFEVGRTAVLLGSSGAGKSTLTNSLMGFTVQKTGAVREDDSRGRHTTTGRQLHLLPSGGCIIDTPGLRGLRLDIDAATLDTLFEDIAELAPHCRFRDCRHEREPGCAVRAALTPDRLANYHKLQREVARDRADVLSKQASKARVKAQQRALRAMQKTR